MPYVLSSIKCAQELGAKAAQRGAELQVSSLGNSVAGMMLRLSLTAVKPT
jgi:hypothetical protein